MARRRGVRSKRRASVLVVIARKQKATEDAELYTIFNPKGIAHRSPGLRGTSYPGNCIHERTNPERVSPSYLRYTDPCKLQAPSPSCLFAVEDRKFMPPARLYLFRLAPARRGMEIVSMAGFRKETTGSRAMTPTHQVVAGISVALCLFASIERRVLVRLRAGRYRCIG